MSILLELSKMTTIDIESLVKRLTIELNVKNKHLETLHYVIFDVINIILGITHQKRVNNQMYTIMYRMITDYWYINGYDKKIKENELKLENMNQDQLAIKSISIGDTTTTFEDNSSKVEIGGVKYEAGTVDLTTNIIIEKYKRELYAFRRMRW